MNALKSDWFNESFQIRKPLGFLLIALFAGVLTVDFMLLRQLRARTAGREGSASLVLKAGSTVPPLEGVTVNGAPLSISYGGRDDRETVLFVFSTHCGICRLTWPRWENLAKTIDRKKYRLVYANLSESFTKENLEEHHLAGATVLAKVDPSTAVAYNLNLTPTVFLIDSRARVERVWIGGREDGLREMDQLLHVAAFPIGDATSTVR